MAYEQEVVRRSPSTTSRIERRTAGALEMAATASVGIVVATLLAIGGFSLASGIFDIQIFMVGVGIALVLGAMPWVLVFGKRIKNLLGFMEAELYRETGILLDLDADGSVGPQEVLHQQTRVIPVRGRVPKPKNDLIHPDGRVIDKMKMRNFVVQSFVSGLGVDYWRPIIGRTDWEVARDILAQFEIASERENGKPGEFFVSKAEALNILGL